MGLSLTVPVDIPTGWECPRCKCVYAPRVESCFRCSPRDVFTGPLPRPKVQAREPPSVPGTFTSGTVSPLAGERLSQVTERTFGPCGPPREGGVCGCGEDNEPPVIPLPPYMSREGAVHISRIGAGWTEIFPGLECAVFWEPDDNGNVVAHFRLTRPEDDGHD